MSEGLAWALTLAGGTALGAYQVPHVEHLWRRLGPPAQIGGGSVGAVNGLVLAHHGAATPLRAIWQEVNGAAWFQRANADLWNGLYSLAPLRRQIEQRGTGKRLAIPLHVGLVDAGSQRYQTVDLEPLPWRDRVDAVIASCTQPFIHEHTRFQGRWKLDSGVVHLAPRLPGWRFFDLHVVIFCSPIGAARKEWRPQPQVAQAWEQGQVAQELLLSAVAARDMQRLRRQARVTPTVVFAPRSWQAVGQPFDASPAAVRGRFQAAQADLQAPVFGALP